MKSMVCTCALVVSGVFASSVSATPLTMSGTLEGFQHGHVSLSVHAQGANSAWHRSNLKTGMFKWSQGNSTFNTFCIELTQSNSEGQNVVFDVNQLNDAPNPGHSNFPHLDGGMGTFRAGLIQDLFNNHHASAIDSVTTAAFQVAIWAILYETDSSQIVAESDDSPNNAYHGINVDAGSFTLRDLGDAGSMRTQVANLANAWLVGLNSVALTNLLALTHDQRQDQVIVIPLPAPLLMAGLGLLAIPLMRRRLYRV